MDGHAPANPLRRSLPGVDRVKPERNLGAAKPPLAKSEANLRPSPAQVTEPPYADPHVRWCGRGGAARLPPIPIRRRGLLSSRGKCDPIFLFLTPVEDS